MVIDANYRTGAFVFYMYMNVIIIYGPIVEVKCRVPSPPIHGDVVNTQVEYPVDDRVEFRCDAGYTLVGAAVWTCRDTGYWDQQCVTCVGPGTHSCDGPFL